MNHYAQRKELLTPQQYLNLTAAEKANIEETKIIPPNLGDDNFGFIEVIWINPKYITPLA